MSIYTNSSLSSSSSAPSLFQTTENLHSPVSQHADDSKAQDNVSKSSLLGRRVTKMAEDPDFSSEKLEHLGQLNLLISEQDPEKVYNLMSVIHEKNLYDFPPKSPFGHKEKINSEPQPETSSKNEDIFELQKNLHGSTDTTVAAETTVAVDQGIKEKECD